MIKKLYITILVGLTISLAGTVLPTTEVVSAQFDPVGEACQKAQNGNPEVCEESQQVDVTKNPTTELILNVSNIVAVAAGFTAVALIVVNGIRYMLSGGDSAKVNSAKNGILFALIGSVLVLAARSIVALVISGL